MIIWVFLLLPSLSFFFWSLNFSQCLISWFDWTDYSWRRPRSSSDRQFFEHRRHSISSEAISKSKRFVTGWKKMKNCKNRWQKMNRKWLWISDVLKENMTARKRVRKCAATAAAVWSEISRSAERQTGKTHIYRQKSMSVGYLRRRESWGG